MKSPFPFCSSLFVASALALPAQTPIDDPVRLPELRVEGQAVSLVAPGIAAATEGLQQIPGGVSLVDAEGYLQGRSSTLEDALAYAPGVIALPRFGSDEARLSIRGSGLQRTYHGLGLFLMQDGVPLNRADGSFDFQSVDLSGARYIEVRRGANALAAGAGTLGGAINFVSRTGRDAAPAQFRLEGGSFGYARAQASGSWTGAKSDGYASLVAAQLGGFRAWSRQKSLRFSANAGVRGATAENRVYLAWVRTQSELPGSLTLAQMEADPTQANPASLAGRQQRNYTLVRVVDKAALRLPGGTLEFNGWWAWKDLFHPIYQVLRQRTHDAGAGMRGTFTPSLAGRPNRLAAGVFASGGTLSDRRFVNEHGQPGAPTAAWDNRAANLVAYADNRLDLAPDWALTTSLQAASARRSAQAPGGAAAGYTRDFSALLPRAGLSWQAAPHTQFFGNVSRSFEPPSYEDAGRLAAPNRAQTATVFEFGGRSTGDNTVQWDAVAYHAQLDYELLALQDTAGNPLGTINAGRTQHTGLELGVAADLLRLSDPARVPAAARLVWRATGTWSRFRFQNDPGFHDNRIAGLPGSLLHTELLYSHRHGFYAGPNAVWAPGRTPVDHANTLFAPGYAIFGFRLGYRPARGWALYAEVKNLFNRVYAATTGVIADARGHDSAQFLPGDGRGFYAGADYRW